MTKIITFILALLFVVAIWFAVIGSVWTLWCWALPQVYPSGPPSLIAPGFWLFTACWTIISAVGQAIFGRRSK